MVRIWWSIFEPQVGRVTRLKKLLSCSMSIKIVSLEESANPKPFVQWMVEKLKLPSKIICLILELMTNFTKLFKL